MNVLISGATGLVGAPLSKSYQAEGHRVVRLTRATPSDGAEHVLWNPYDGKLDASKLEGFDAIVHLAGDNIAKGRWTATKKKRIRDSRVLGTKLLADTIAKLEKPPAALVCASAIGFYGNRGDDILHETSGAGTGFLADVCQEWENAGLPAKGKTRLVQLRIGVVLSTQGGALKAMLLPFQLGVGGVVGSGAQYMSWIDLSDLVRVIRFAVATPSLEGPVNAVAPHPVTNREYTKALGHVLGRPTIIPMPAFAARLALGQMADDLLLSSTRVEPEKLNQAGFKFNHGTIEASLNNVFAKGV